LSNEFYNEKIGVILAPLTSPPGKMKKAIKRIISIAFCSARDVALIP
jgi:hypothetical protein